MGLVMSLGMYILNFLEKFPNLEVWGDWGGGEEKCSREKEFFQIQADKNGVVFVSLLVLCSDDRVSFLSGERGDWYSFLLPLYEARGEKNRVLEIWRYTYFLILTPRAGPTQPLYSKILTTIVSTFTSYYIYLWPSFFPNKPLSSPLPSFDGRVVQYPTVENLRDYLSWRQVDCMLCNLSAFLLLFSLSKILESTGLKRFKWGLRCKFR